MRKVLIYLLPLLLLCSCTKELVEDPIKHIDGTDVPDGYALVEFGISMPMASTKTMAMTPDIASLHIAVFDEVHYLEDYVTAESIGPGSNPDSSYPDENYDPDALETTVWKYKAVLPTSDEYRIIHFLANGPDELEFGTEMEVIGDLVSTGTQDAYWQRKILTNGIVADKSTGRLKAETANELKNIALIRNFAAISSSAASDSNFLLKYFCVVNNATSGTVAPYNSTTGDFVDSYHTSSSVELRTAGYNASMPRTYDLNSDVPSGDPTNTVMTDDGDWLLPSSSAFVFERETPKSDPVYLIVYGTYTDPDTHVATDCYYKVNMKDDDNQYFPILRNFKYTIHIKKVTAVGQLTLEGAMLSPGSGDISTAIGTEGYNNISDGISRMKVSFTERTVVSNAQITNFLCAFYPNFKEVAHRNEYAGTDSYIIDTDNTMTVSDLTNGQVLVQAEAVSTPAFTFSKGSFSTTGDQAGFQQILINPVSPVSGKTLTQKLILTGKATDGSTLQREIVIVVREAMELSLACDPDAIPKKAGTSFDLVISIPGGLPQMIFPLEMSIEAEQMTIAPDKGDNLPVQTGKSTINNSKTAFYFIKTISWDDYQRVALGSDGTKPFRCHFKSNTAISATDIYVSNPYFVSGEHCTLGNYDPYAFANLAWGTGASFAQGGNVGFKFDFESAGAYNSLDGKTVTVTLVGLEPAENEDRLTYVGASATVANGVEYSLSSFTQTGNSLNLSSTTNNGYAAVYLDAYHFEQKALRRVRRVTANANDITFSNTNSGQLFGSSYSDDYSGNVLIRTEQYPSDMNGAPSTSVTRSGNYSSRVFKNTDPLDFEIPVDVDKLYFLYKHNDGVIYSGELAVTPGTSALTLSGTVTFSQRKAQGAITVEDMAVNVGQTLPAVISSNTNAGAALSYVSSDPDIAIVSSDGHVTGVSVGSTIITVTAAATSDYAETSTTFVVTVAEPSVWISVDDVVNGTTKEDLDIRNTGNTKVFIRAAIAANWYDSHGNIVAPWSESQGTFTGLTGSGWTKGADGLYYLDDGVESGSSAPDLFTRYVQPADPPVAGAHLEMSILAQAIPYVDGKTCQQAFNE